jgi:hypothetical protein
MGRYHKQVTVLAEYLKDHSYVEGGMVQQILDAAED